MSKSYNGNIQLENLVELLDNKNIRILVKCYSNFVCNGNDQHWLTSSCNPKKIVELVSWFSATGFTNTLETDV